MISQLLSINDKFLIQMMKKNNREFANKTIIKIDLVYDNPYLVIAFLLRFGLAEQFIHSFIHSFLPRLVPIGTQRANNPICIHLQPGLQRMY